MVQLGRKSKTEKKKTRYKKWRREGSACEAMEQHFLFLLFMVCMVVVICLLCYDFMKRRKKWKDYPPGPLCVPFLGNMLQVDFNNMGVSFDKIQKKYGNVYSLQFCWTNAVVINGFEAIKDALIQKSDDFADKPYYPIFQHLGFEEHCEGILAARYGPHWKEQRKFFLSALRNFGLGTKSLEERVIQEARFLCTAFLSQEGQGFDPYFLLSSAVGNVISFIAFGERFDYGHDRFRRLLHNLEQGMKAETGFLAQIMNFVPVLVRIPGISHLFFRPEKNFTKCVEEFTQEHKATWDPAITRDAIDAFLEEMEKAKVHPKSSFNEKNLLFIIADLFAAGTETSSTTLRWGLVYMLLYPDIQSQVQHEIDNVIGRERFPVLEDQASLPFTNAVIHEIQRCGDILPVPYPHSAYRDSSVHGFFIPKVVECVWENNWPGWRCLFSSPPYCSNSPSQFLLENPFREMMVFLK